MPIFDLDEVSKGTSPILFIINAFIAALLAAILVYQKFINKYEHKPTPSQPINNCNKFAAVTNTIMKKVNKDKYDKNLGKCGSLYIYSIEYKCTQKEIPTITNNITLVNASNKNSQ